jgi:signal transduction histidine kinase
VDQEGDKVISVETSATEVNGQRCLMLTVRDNGPGVVADKEELLFESRFTTKHRGHGIGLITCRKIVDNHQGQISYVNNDGAEFNVKLPVVSPHQEPAATFQAAGVHSPG